MTTIFSPLIRINIILELLKKINTFCVFFPILLQLLLVFV